MLKNILYVDGATTDWFCSPSSFRVSFVRRCGKRLAKLELYQKFTNSLAVFVLLSIAWIGYEVLPFELG